MDWLQVVLKSEFLWGTILGIVLSVLTSWTTLQFQTRQQTKTVHAFINDLVSNLQDYSRSLVESRERTGSIYLDIIALIENEIGIWSRNREHLILIKDEAARKRVRDYFSKAAKLSVDVRNGVERFYELQRIADANSEAQDGQNRQLSLGALQFAQGQCDRLTHYLNVSPLNTVLT